MEKWLRLLGRLEACSFLLLLLIAMPLKYMLGIPEGVRVMGPVHGILFLGYCAWACYVGLEQGWSARKHMFAYLAAIIPCGTFWFERVYLREDFDLKPKSTKKLA